MRKLIQIILFILLIVSCKQNINGEIKINHKVEFESNKFEKQNQMKELEYLKTNIFYGLTNLNDGFDSETIYYFSESDFEIVLNRVEKNGIGIYGIEPWINGNFYDVKGFEDYNTKATDAKWYKKAFMEFKKSGKELMYSASYELPKKLITE